MSKPVYRAVFATGPTTFATHKVQVNALPYMHLPGTAAPAQIYPELGLCSVGAVLLTIEDIGEETTALVSQVLKGQSVEVWLDE